MEERYDVIIIGGGPAGLAAAIYAGREALAVVSTTPEKSEIIRALFLTAVPA